MKDRDSTHCKVTKIFTYDIAVEPSFGSATINNSFTVFPSRQSQRKNKIKKIFNFPCI